MTPLTPPALLLAGLLAAAGAAAQTAAAPAAEHKMMSPAELKWAPLPSLPPGATFAVLEGPMDQPAPFTARLRLPANYRIPAHFHPAVERVSVLSGSLHMGVGEKLDMAKAHPIETGGFAVMPAQQPHYVFTRDQPVELQLHGTGPWGITYLNPADDPRRKQQ